MSPSKRTRFHVMLIVTSLAICTCSTPRTEIIVVVDTDMQIPAEIDAVTIRVTSPDDDIKESVGSLDGPADLPASLGLVHEGGPLGPFNVLALGQRSGVDQIEREARVSFVREETVVLAMHLVRACLGTSCPSGQTCTERGCESIELDSDALPSWTGTPPRLDGGDGDADGDSDGDADGDVDGDGDEYLTCTGDECICPTSGSCDLHCLDECNLTCDDDFCNFICEANCSISCIGGSDCTIEVADGASVECRGGANCDVTCRNDCTLACRSNDTCIVRCLSGGDCSITNCSDTISECGDGVSSCGVCP